MLQLEIIFVVFFLYSICVCLLKNDVISSLCLCLIVVNYSLSIVFHELFKPFYLIGCFSLDLFVGLTILQVSGKKVWGLLVCIAFTIMILLNILGSYPKILWAMNMLSLGSICMSSLICIEYNDNRDSREGTWNNIFCYIAKGMHRKVYTNQE